MVLLKAVVALCVACMAGFAMTITYENGRPDGDKFPMGSYAFSGSQSHVVFFALAQDASQQQKEAPPKKAEPAPAPAPEPAPLFGGKLGTQSSQKKKESATLGFNGIDPSGKVSDRILSTSATSDHQAKVKKMNELAPGPADVDAFIKEGGLNKR